MGLREALTDSGDTIEPLPSVAVELLEALAAPPRLAAHLRAVHHVAHRLTRDLAADGLEFDRDAVLFGAATHDIGKVRHPEELEQPGHEHEQAGYELLLSFGVPPERARFAGTHGASWHDPDAPTEDLLVSLADKIWKAARVTPLEQSVLQRLRGEEWDAFLRLSNILEPIARDADRLLAFQAGHPVRIV
jgi:putative nucleotidyltransferase with HDIG domain